MNRGYIKIRENGENQFVVEAKLVNCTLWMTKHEIASLFNVYVSSIGNQLRSIFKFGLLCEDEVSCIHTYKYNGRESEMKLYNLEALIFVSYRTASFEARAFREWGMKALTEYIRTKPQKEKEVLVVYNLSSRFTDIKLN